MATPWMVDLTELKSYRTKFEFGCEGVDRLEHNKNDGLMVNVNGVRHGILVPVPVNLMEKAGTYYFVLHFKDNHADKYKDHQVKPALELNQIHPWYPITYHSGTYAGSKWHVAWCRAPRMVRKRTFLEPKGTNVLEKVKAEAEVGTGKVASGVNGGFPWVAK